MRYFKALLFLICCLLLFTFKGLAQQNHGYQYKRATHWYFGNGAGLDFSSGTPVAVTNGALHTYEGCATISDTAGNLLFYTDGDTIWNRNNLPMPNGTGLLGCPLYGSSAQAALIIPQPGKDSLYYVFTTDCFEDTGHFGLRYSIVNMQLNGGIGDVIISSKNILLHDSVAEGQTATFNCDYSAVWLMAHEYNSNHFLAYKINSNGIDTIPVISAIGNVYKDLTTYMRFSPNGKLLASAYNRGSALFKFDDDSGILSDAVSLPTFSGDYGTCFSPDNSKLYFMNSGSYIIQFDVSAYTSSPNPPVIDSSIVGYHPDNSAFGAISNAINGKMYIASLYYDSISTITQPDLQGNACNILVRNLALGENSSELGLPDFIQSYFNTSPNKTCSDSSDTIETPPVKLSIPNVFTPNGDGINDAFSITLSGYKKIDWQLFNRWGVLITSGNIELKDSSKVLIALWNGETKSGTEANDGVYYYIIHLTRRLGKTKTKKGFLTLLN